MGLLLVFFCHSSGSDVIEILKPLEVRDGDTTTIHKQVRNSDNPSLNEYLFGSIGRGAVGSFEDGLNFNLLSIAHVQHLFNSGRNHAISLL